MKTFKSMTVGQIVADNFDYAAIFDRFGIDFCCNGHISLEKACEKANADMDIVVKELENTSTSGSGSIDFQSWHTDLLSDYILKFHHRNIRRDGLEIQRLADRVCDAHGGSHPELHKVRDHLFASMVALENHLNKEEQMLFPYIYDLCDATRRKTTLPAFHCGTVEAPISVMMAEHDDEGERYREISRLTNGYTTPEDGCHSYRLLMEKTKAFEQALHEHIHLENNIVFPRAIEMEKSHCHADRS